MKIVFNMKEDLVYKIANNCSVYKQMRKKAGYGGIPLALKDLWRFITKKKIPGYTYASATGLREVPEKFVDRAFVELAKKHPAATAATATSGAGLFGAGYYTGKPGESSAPSKPSESKGTATSESKGSVFGKGIDIDSKTLYTGGGAVAGGAFGNLVGRVIAPDLFEKYPVLSNVISAGVGATAGGYLGHKMQ